MAVTDTITVSSVVPALTEKELATNKQVIVTVSRKKSKNSDAEIPVGQRSRSIIIDELTIDGVPAKFKQLVLSSLYLIARDVLDDAWKKEGDALKEMNAGSFTVDSLLMYAAAQEESKRLTSAGIAIWYESSVLRSRIMKIADEAKRAATLKKYAEAFTKLAAPVPDFTLEELQQLQARLADEDTENLIVSQLNAKITRRIKDITTVREAAFDDAF